MGNKLDIGAWWDSKYRTIKQRVSAWKSIAHMSLTGRNLLLQAILYGSLRFWFFSLVVSEKVIECIESDAYHLLWASNPEFLSNEEGTAKKTRAYIHRPATYLPQKEGGASLTHVRSHIKAFYAQWIRRYLHPNKAPWKLIADVWLANPYPLGRGSLLSSITGSFHTDIPPTAPYLRACVKAFEEIKLKQNTSILDGRVIGEPVFLNHRFDPPVSDQHAQAWSKCLGAVRIDKLIELFDDLDMEAFA